MTQLAAETTARALILESTFSSLREVAAVHYSRLAWVVPLKKLNSVVAIEKYDGPLLQCHGNRDQTIPIELAEKLHAVATGPKKWVVIEGGDHNDAHSDRYQQVFAQFIDSLPKAD